MADVRYYYCEECGEEYASQELANECAEACREAMAEDEDESDLTPDQAKAEAALARRALGIR